MYTLYGWKLTGSLAVEAGLREAGAEFDIVPANLQADEQHSEEFQRNACQENHLYPRKQEHSQCSTEAITLSSSAQEEG
ncbi:MAG: hypothetical protein ACE10A_14460 [Acidiferrobacterales bacterium]